MASTMTSPLDRVFALETTADRRHTLMAALVAALSAHAGMAGAIHLRGARAIEGPSVALEEDDVTLEERETPPPPPPPESELPPPPSPPSLKVTAPVTAAAPPREPTDEPPASEAAQAGEVLVQDDDADEDDSDEEDDNDNTFVTGHEESYSGGMTSSGGSSVAAVHGSIVAKGGVPGGSGTAVAAPKPGGKDLSREAWLEGNTSWDCDFPGEADRDHIDNAVVEMRVTVRSDGTAVAVEILEDPGHGFARMASACALKHKFTPALDREGKPTWATTRRFHVGFHR
jgi:protein TonB